MRIVFCGSGSLAVPSLGKIPAAGHEIVGVISQPPRPAGRGGKLRATALADAARAAGLELLEVPKINAPDAVAWVAARRPDVIVVVDFGQMVRAAIRAAARLDTINLHASLLPALRGAAPINWAVIRGCRKTGLSTFSLVDKLDAGPIYVQEEVVIPPEETADELRTHCAEFGASVMCRTLEAIEAGAKPRPQDETLVTLAPILQKSDGVIDWSAPAAAIRNRIHGTWPWPGGQAVFRRQSGSEVPVILGRAAEEEGPATGSVVAAAASATTAPAATATSPHEPGVLGADLCVATGAGWLRVLQIKPAGGRLMAWRDFVNGYRVLPGDRFVRAEGHRS